MDPCAHPPFPADPSFARAILNAAAEVEAAESAIKAEILRCAKAGDAARIVDLIARWQTVPASEVLHGNGLATCGKPEVQDERRRKGGA